MTQEVEDPSLQPYGGTYIPSSYVKYIESGGARVTPIRYAGSDLSQVTHGIKFGTGSSYLSQSSAPHSELLALTHLVRLVSSSP